MDETPAKPDQPTAVKSPRRRRYQFTLRTLLIFVTLAGCGFGLLGMKVREARRQAAAVAAIEKLGGQVFYDYQFDSQDRFLPYAVLPGPLLFHALLPDDFFRTVHAVELAGAPLTAADLENLKSLPRLAILRFHGSTIADAELVYLKELTTLKQLDFDDTQVTEAGMKKLNRELPDCVIGLSYTIPAR
jgi:hypothetical protein